MNPEEKPTQESNELSKIDISELVTLLSEYNKPLGLGSMMAKGLTTHLKKETGMEYEDDLTQATADQILSYENMKISSGPILRSTGLGLKSINNGSVNSSEGSVDIKELKLHVVNGDQFLKYIKSLNNTNMTESQVWGLNEVARTLISQFRGYDLKNPSDEFIALIKNLSNILEEYKRLGFEGLDFLYKIQEYSNSGCLKEFMLADSLSLTKDFVPGSGYTLEWHRDATPEVLRKYWGGVIDALAKIYSNEKAIDIYIKAKIVANQAMENAINEIVIQRSNANPSRKDYADKLYPVLLLIKQTLNDF